MLLCIRRKTNSSSTAPCRPLLSSLDCFTVTTGGRAFNPGAENQFNRYAQDDDNGVITIPLCQTEGRFGCDGLAYVMRHPNYDGLTRNGNDIALIFLQSDLPEEIDQIPNVALNCNPSVPAVGQDLEAFGWGSTDFPTQVNPNEIQTATIQAVTNADCGNDRDDILCAGQAGISAAPGDSGTCNSSA